MEPSANLHNHHFKYSLYSWPLNNTDLNCTGLLICRFFSIVNTTALRGPPRCRTTDTDTDTEETPIGRAYEKLQADFPLRRGLALLTLTLFKVNCIEKRNLSSYITNAITAWGFLWEVALYPLLACSSHKHWEMQTFPTHCIWDSLHCVQHWSIRQINIQDYMGQILLPLSGHPTLHLPC